jgi:HK97 family phage portal protein
MGALGDVYGIVSLIASSTGKAGWRLYRKQPQDGRRRYTTGDHGDDQRTEVTRHAALDLWNGPNLFLTQRAFVEGQQQHLELTGEGYWVFKFAANFSLPLNMFYVRPDRMEPVPDPEKFIAGWIYTAPGGEQVPLQVNEVIGPPSLAFPNPWDIYHGLGPVQAVLVDIQAASYSVQWNRNFFYNNASPGGIVQVPNKWNDADFDQFTTRWRETHFGITAAGRVGVLEGGATWQPAQPTMRDMQFSELRQISGDTIRRAWRVHKHMLGDVDDVNRANAETAEETFARWITSDRLDRLKDVLNGPFLRMYGAEDEVEFDYTDPVPDNREADNVELKTKADAFAQFVQQGMDPHDALEMAGLPDADFPAAPGAYEPPIAPAAQGADAQGDAGERQVDDMTSMSNAFRRLRDRQDDEQREMVEALRHLNGNGHKKVNA